MKPLIFTVLIPSFLFHTSLSAPSDSSAHILACRDTCDKRYVGDKGRRLCHKGCSIETCIKSFDDDCCLFECSLNSDCARGCQWRNERKNVHVPENPIEMASSPFNFHRFWDRSIVQPTSQFAKQHRIDRVFNDGSTFFGSVFDQLSDMTSSLPTRFSSIFSGDGIGSNLFRNGGGKMLVVKSGPDGITSRKEVEYDQNGGVISSKSESIAPNGTVLSEEEVSNDEKKPKEELKDDTEDNKLVKVGSLITPELFSNAEMERNQREIDSEEQHKNEENNIPRITPTAFNRFLNIFKSNGLKPFFSNSKSEPLRIQEPPSEDNSNVRQLFVGGPSVRVYKLPRVILHRESPNFDDESTLFRDTDDNLGEEGGSHSPLSWMAPSFPAGFCDDEGYDEVKRTWWCETVVEGPFAGMSSWLVLFSFTTALIMVLWMLIFLKRKTALRKRQALIQQNLQNLSRGVGVRIPNDGLTSRYSNDPTEPTKRYPSQTIEDGEKSADLSAKGKESSEKEKEYLALLDSGHALKAGNIPPPSYDQLSVTSIAKPEMPPQYAEKEKEESKK